MYKTFYNSAVLSSKVTTQNGQTQEFHKINSNNQLYMYISDLKYQY